MPNIPTILIVFGATGDLMRRKIIPALYHAYLSGKLPKMFKVVGFTRRDLSEDDFKSFVLEIILQYNPKADKKYINNFISLFYYQRGLFDDKKAYKSLSKKLAKMDREWGVCTNKLFYLAVPPESYERIFNNISYSDIANTCNPEEGWTRIIVEKPFGRDLKTSEELDILLGKLFQETQIYRIDHYLAKEMVQNILSFRFSNNIFEHVWDNRFIEAINIRLWEKLGVEKRGDFYDGIGALRDVGQNHLLQMLALITMDYPDDLSADSIRKNRASIISTLNISSKEVIKKNTFRAQYNGFKDIKGVGSNSNTETYFKIKTFLGHPKWKGVPIILESGKRMAEQKKEIEVVFKHPTPCLCPEGEHLQNKVIITLEPKERIEIKFWSKKPGFNFEVEARTFDFVLRPGNGEKKGQYIEEYEKLLLDCINGDQTLFISTDEIEAMWRFVDPILESWNKDLSIVETYDPDTNQAAIKSIFVNNFVAVEDNKKNSIGIIGLGKMGGNIARNLMNKSWNVSGYNKSKDTTKILEKEGMRGAYSMKDLISSLPLPRLVWLMVPAGKQVDEVLFGKEGLIKYLSKGDIVIDGGNSYFKDDIIRNKKLAKEGIKFIDVGVSGGPVGALNGASLMIGGKKETFLLLEGLFKDLTIENGYKLFEGVGAGHFVKMIHNGIEYGMMQAIAEGFNIMKNAQYNLNLEDVAKVYNNGSVIESRLIKWLEGAFEAHGQSLQGVSGSVGFTGEGEWTVKTAKEMRLKAKVIEESFKLRKASQKKPDYAGQILSALREQFGGHDINRNPKS